jgi:hypothetical protein
MNNKAFFLIAIAFLTSVMTQLSAQMVADLSSGTLSLIPETLYVRKQILGGGQIDLLTTSTLNKPGVCNFDANILQSGRILVFDQIAIGYKSAATTGQEGNVTYNAIAPKELQNAIFTISQKGKVLFSKPFGDLHNVSAGLAITANDAYTELKALALLVDNNPITMKLQFPEGVVLDDTTVKHYIEVRLNGLATSPK